MNVATITAGSVETNSYVLYNENHECIVVDPGDGISEIIEFLSKNALVCKYVLLTHAHFDHCVGCVDLQARGAKVCLSKLDLSLLSSDDNLADAFGEKFEPFVPDFTIDDGGRNVVSWRKFFSNIYARTYTRQRVL